MFNPIAVVLIVVSLLFGGAGATAYAAQGSLPADALYPVKTLTEDLRLSLPAGEEDKLDLALAYAERRVGEIEALAGMGVRVNGEVVSRLGEQAEEALRLAAGMPEQAQPQALARVASRLGAMAGAIEQLEGGTQPLLLQARRMLQEQSRLAESGLADPQGLQNQLRERAQLRPWEVQDDDPSDDNSNDASDDNANGNENGNGNDANGNGDDANGNADDANSNADDANSNGDDANSNGDDANSNGNGNDNGNGNANGNGDDNGNDDANANGNHNGDDNGNDANGNGDDRSGNDNGNDDRGNDDRGGNDNGGNDDRGGDDNGGNDDRGGSDDSGNDDSGHGGDDDDRDDNSNGFVLPGLVAAALNLA